MRTFPGASPRAGTAGSGEGVVGPEAPGAAAVIRGGSGKAASDLAGISKLSMTCMMLPHACCEDWMVAVSLGRMPVAVTCAAAHQPRCWDQIHGTRLGVDAWLCRGCEAWLGKLGGQLGLSLQAVRHAGRY
jgi:hypothetical protein